MEKEKKAETVICPHCGAKLDVGGNYGIGLKCSACGGKIDVFPDDSVVIHTEFGKIAIEFPSSGNGGVKGALLSAALRCLG